jgi:hypothetical protein
MIGLAGSEELKGHLFRPPFTFTPNPVVTSALSGLEAAYDDTAAFRAFCRRFRAEHLVDNDASGLAQPAFNQWFLEPTEAEAVREPPLQYDEFGASLLTSWDWHDPLGDCSFRMENGLEIHAAPGRDLWGINWSAPRMQRLASGDLAVQTVCTRVFDRDQGKPAGGVRPTIGVRPAIGGLVLWKNRENYLRLERGTMGEDEVLFGGCLGGQDMAIGRGRLELASARGSESVGRRGTESLGRVFLRLERIGDRVSGLCSADGKRWFSVGCAPFSVENPVQIALHAIGNVDRTIYHGAHSDGVAIRFELFQLWRLKQ